MDSAFLLVSAFVAYFVIIPAGTFFLCEERHRDRWRQRWLVEVAEPTPGGPFRDEDGAAPPRRYVVEHRGAPRHVKGLVVVSLVLGHMFVPGLLAGLCGLPIYGLGLASLPGLWLAAGIYRNAFAVLRCEPAAAAEARRLQRFSERLNVVVIAVVLVLGLVWGFNPLSLFTIVYACISLRHAHCLGRAADAIDAVWREELEVVPEGASVVPRAARPAA
jgi:hypothetical protein